MTVKKQSQTASDSPQMTDAQIAVVVRTADERIEDEVSMCVYVSRKLGIELTLARAGRIWNKIEWND